MTPESLEAQACRDIDDDVVLATARAGDWAAIVTGDQDLLILDPFYARGTSTVVGTDVMTESITVSR